jgi:AmmeMemoRadiSam system protein B
VTKEHGIGEHFIFIAKYFPRTSVMPVVVRRKLHITHEEEEVAHVIASLTGKTLVLTSVDFSHHVDE